MTTENIKAKLDEIFEPTIEEAILASGAHTSCHTVQLDAEEKS